MKNEQPAVKSYFFGKGYKVLFKTISDAWSNNEMSAAQVKEKIRFIRENRSNGMIMRWIDRIIILFKWFEYFSIYFFGSAICAVLSSIHMLILFSFMLVIYIAFMFIWAADRSYILIKGIFGACPKCKGKYTMPVYVCKCGAEHTRLTPGVYGILKRKCLCGEKLPTTFFNGRRFLTSKCPHCGNQIVSKEAIPICVPVIGGPSVGKTCFITALMKELTERACPLTDMYLNFYDYRNQIECTQMLAKYNSGVLQTKTSDVNPVAFNYFISGKGIVPERLLYLYDIAGEAFGANDALSTQKQYEYCHGFIFLIDPLTIQNIRGKYSGTDKFSEYSAGSADIDDTFDVFLSNLKRISGLSANKLSKVPCAVVVNKIDAFDIENEIGEQAAKRLTEEQKGRFKNTDDAISYLTKEFLQKNGMNNFVNNIDICFKKKRYFSCSSIGHVQNGQRFSPVSVFKPFTWIVGKFDRKLNGRFSAYISDNIKIKFPKKSVKLADNKKYRVLSWMNFDDNTYFCLAGCDESGKVIAEAAEIYYCKRHNAKKGLNKLIKSELSEKHEKIEEIEQRLELKFWNIRLKYYTEHNKINKQA